MMTTLDPLEVSLKAKNNDSQIELKPRLPSTVMRLKRMGSFHQCRLSFMRVLLRKLKQENWTFDRPVFRVDNKGVGVATYAAHGPKRTYTLIAFAHDLPAEKRSDRVIAEAWDATFTLFDGTPTEEDIERLSMNVPYQEAGRVSESELSLSRANRSVRLFEYVKSCLAKGEQPQADELDKVGYLMRTTAVYGSGKFGAADRSTWETREEFQGSFQPELLSVYLIRQFALDMVEYMAQVEAPETAIKLAPELSRRLGIGNSTGLGMAPFLINHPALLNAWINAKEMAFATVRNIETASSETIAQFKSLVFRAQKNADTWHSAHDVQVKKLSNLKSDLGKTITVLETDILEGSYPWNTLYEWAEETLSLEGQEQLLSLMIEPHGELIDHYAETMSADETNVFRINGAMKLNALKTQIETSYQWLDEFNFSEDAANARVWYVSEEKLEPRLGERFNEPIEPYEQALSPGRDVARLKASTSSWDDNETVAHFLMQQPEHRHIVRRIQYLSTLPYGEIQDNTIADNMMPIDLLRCKLSFFGATKFDPRSDRWVRITMYQNTPYLNELEALDPDELAYPPLGN